VSSKRRLRRKACHGKVRYDARSTAAAAAKTTTGGRHWLHAYHCPHCTGWHIGHPTGRQRHAARAAIRERRQTT
jgi:hypothetical protein